MEGRLPAGEAGFSPSNSVEVVHLLEQEGLYVIRTIKTDSSVEIIKVIIQK